ncbi:MAG TPA: DnaB-like helicase C-terminal domain-containing protein [Spirochaetota bacterium]|nr:DnaB-like helicase C-terminal domain-containing protein [Spirochaetota bacterium]
MNSAPDLLPLESAVLSTAMCAPEARRYILQQLDAGDFTKAAHKFIYSAINKVVVQGLDVDTSAVHAVLVERNAPGETISAFYDIIKSYTTVNFKQYVEQIRDHSERTRAVSILRMEAERLEKEPGATLDDAAAALQDLRARPSRTITPRTREDVSRGIVERRDGVSTGFCIEGDELTAQSGALTIPTGPTGHGKTAFMLNCAVNMVRAGIPVYFFSYEETISAVDQKFISILHGKKCGFNNKESVKAYFRLSKNPELKNAVDEYFSLVESGTLNVIQSDFDAPALCSLIYQVPRNAVVLIDYIQLLYLNSEKFQTRTEELKKIALLLKDTAVNTQIPIIAAAQFNREVVNPLRMAAQRLAESSDIEKAANKIIGLWNGSKKMEKNKDEIKRIEEMGITAGTIYMEVLKARDEASGAADIFKFDGNIGTMGAIGFSMSNTGGRRNYA